MFSSFAQISPYMLGLFMFALACVPLIFVWQDSRRRQNDKKRLSALRRKAQLAARLHDSSKELPGALVPGWVGEARR